MDATAIATAAIVAGGPILAVLITHLLTRRTLSNGLKSVQNEIHRDVKLIVLPQLQELTRWRRGYEGTIWADNDAIEEWTAALDERLSDLERRLRDHDQWERGVKWNQDRDPR